MHFVHWWSASNAVELGGGIAGCGIMHGDGVDVAQWQSVGVWGEWGVRRERR